MEEIHMGLFWCGKHSKLGTPASGKRIEGWEVQEGTCWVETSDGVRSDIVIYFTNGRYMYAKLVR